MPGTDATSTIRFRPPRVPLALAGQQPFTVRVISRQHPDEVATESGVLTVGDVRALAATIVPATAKSSGSASYEVRVENQGNRPVDIALVASDPDEALKLVLDAPLHSDPARCHAARRPQGVAAGRVALGAAERRSFRVDVMSEGQQAAQASGGARPDRPAPELAADGRRRGGRRRGAPRGRVRVRRPAAGGDEPSTRSPGSRASRRPHVAPSVEVPPSAETPSEPSAEPPSEEPSTEPSPPRSPRRHRRPRRRPDDCARGFRWRETNPIDHVCVTRDTVDQARFDESQATLRWTDGDRHPHVHLRATAGARRSWATTSA